MIPIAYTVFPCSLLIPRKSKTPAKLPLQSLVLMTVRTGHSWSINFVAAEVAITSWNDSCYGKAHVALLTLTPGSSFGKAMLNIQNRRGGISRSRHLMEQCTHEDLGSFSQASNPWIYITPNPKPCHRTRKNRRPRRDIRSAG